MRLTQATVSRLSLPSGKAEHFEWDDKLPGFGVRLRAGGKRTWVAQYRLGSKQRRVSLGRVGTLDADEARSVGLVNYVFADARLDAEVQHYVDLLLGYDHSALRTCKSFFSQLPDLRGATGAEYAITLLAAIGTSR